MKTAQNLLTPAEQDDLKRSVAEVESRTSGEIVPVIANSSHDYPRPALLGALVLSLATALGIAMLLKTESMWDFLIYFLIAHVFFQFLMHLVPALKRPFILKSELEEEVHEAALTTFYSHGLFNTRDRTGILIYVSVFERKVWVLADSGINEKVDSAVWNEIVRMVTDGLRINNAGDALCRAVTRCGELLATHFPVRDDDTNELPDLIIAD